MNRRQVFGDVANKMASLGINDNFFIVSQKIVTVFLLVSIDLNPTKKLGLRVG